MHTLDGGGVSKHDENNGKTLFSFQVLRSSQAMRVYSKY